MVGKSLGGFAESLFCYRVVRRDRLGTTAADSLQIARAVVPHEGNVLSSSYESAREAQCRPWLAFFLTLQTDQEH